MERTQQSVALFASEHGVQSGWYDPRVDFARTPFLDRAVYMVVLAGTRRMGSDTGASYGTFFVGKPMRHPRSAETE